VITFLRFPGPTRFMSCPPTALPFPPTLRSLSSFRRFSIGRPAGLGFSAHGPCSQVYCPGSVWISARPPLFRFFGTSFGDCFAVFAFFKLVRRSSLWFTTASLCVFMRPPFVTVGDVLGGFLLSFSILRDMHGLVFLPRFPI